MSRIFFAIFILIPLLVYPKVLKVGVWDNPPLSIIDNNKVTGFAPDIFRKVAEDQKIEFQFLEGRWQDLYPKLENGEIDIFIPIGFSEKRLEKMDFSKYPIFTNWGQIVSKKGVNLSSINSLANKRIAVQKNDLYFYGDFGLKKLVDDFHINLNIIWVDNYKEGLNKVLNDEAECTLVAKSFLYSTKDENVYLSSIFVQPVEVHFGYSKNLDRAIKDKIDRGLKSLLDDPKSYYYNRLKYLKESGYYEYEFLYQISKYFMPILVVVSVLLFVLLIFNYLLKRQVAQKTRDLNITLNKLQESESRLKAILSSMPNIIFILNKDLRYVDVITNNEGLLLLPKDAIIGKSIYDFFNTEKYMNLIDHVKEVIEKGVHSNIIYDLTINGEKRYFESFGVPLKIGNNIFGLFQVVERTDLVMANENYKKAITELSIEKDKLNRILNSIKEIVIFSDINGKITFYNKTASGYFGIAISNKNISEIKIYDKNGELYDLNSYKEGKLVNISINNGYLMINDKKIEVEGEIQPIYDHLSKYSGILLVLRDITEEKKIERELIKADKLESIGRIAAGIAHDFNNYLGAIQNYVNVLAIEENESIRNIAGYITSIINRSKSLTSQLLTFAKGGKPLLKLIDIKNVVKEVTTFSLKGSNITEEFDIPDEIFCAEIDVGLFSQVVSNIVINARDAMKDSGKVKVALRKVDIDQNNHYNLNPGKYIMVSIKDSGPGIPESIGRKIYEPFFTTKSKGTGLGLATCYAIIKDHRGSITYVNHPDGCEFIFFISAAEDSFCKNDDGIKKDNNIYVDNKIKVLYMDDEEILLDSFSLLMEVMGANVVTAENGEKVIELVKTEAFDMIVLDLTIRSGLNGADTIKKLKEMGIKSFFVVSSGYSNDPIIQRYEEYGFDDYLPKPYGLMEIKEMFERYRRKISI